MNRDKSKGLKTMTEKADYQISADLGQTISTYNSTLIVSYIVKHEQDGVIGGAYIKLLPEDLDQTHFNSSSSYYLMYGQDYDLNRPDWIQLIICKDNKEYQHYEPIRLHRDSRSHMFTFIIFPDLSYEARIDDIIVRDGKLYDDFQGAFEGPTIEDPNATKPSDWFDYPEIPDPKAKKPKDWDDRLTIPDPNDKKPDDWEETHKGKEWKQRMIANKNYMGTWMPPVITNTKYKGPWHVPHIPNPHWEEARKEAAFDKVRYIGIEIYQHNPGTIFRHFFIGNETKEYRQYVRQCWDPIKKYEDVYEPSSSSSIKTSMFSRRKKRNGYRKIRRQGEEGNGIDDDSLNDALEL